MCWSWSLSRVRDWVMVQIRIWVSACREKSADLPHEWGWEGSAEEGCVPKALGFRPSLVGFLSGMFVGAEPCLG